MKIKLNGKRIHPTDSVKYLGVKIDSKLNWKGLHCYSTISHLYILQEKPFQNNNFKEQNTDPSPQFH